MRPTADGRRLFYAGDGEGPAVVLAHDAPTSDHQVWDAQVDAISRRCPIVRYDLPGYGRSSRPRDETYRHCDDLAAIMHGLGSKAR